jgi:hypothetical protein
MRDFVKLIDSMFLKNILKKTISKFSFLSLIRHNNYFDGVMLVNYNILDSLELNQYCEKYGSDKGYVENTTTKSWPPHNFADIYALLFGSRRQEILKVFEMGIGTKDLSLPSNMGSYGFSGASLRIWRDYFPNAMIFGADIDKSILFQEERIQTYYVDQRDTDSIGELWQAIGGGDFDIMIDDGLHTVEAAINLFTSSIDYLKNSGIYIIEDITMERLSGIMEYFHTKPFRTALFSSHRAHYKVGDNMLLVIRKA